MIKVYLILVYLILETAAIYLLITEFNIDMFVAIIIGCLQAAAVAISALNSIILYEGQKND